MFQEEEKSDMSLKNLFLRALLEWFLFFSFVALGEAFFVYCREKWWDGGDETVAGWQSIVIGATTSSEVAGGEGRPQHSERKKERKKRNGRREEEEEEKGEKMGRCDCGGKRWVLRRRRRK
ncbi:hypothetical protein CK203_013139 [Vitis vinifera]|uniref:Uncharacterized protein n=1 Tax=Vitis vinifera TaxID=29760 RepID=A0A438JQB1_VITVI|nr:hypothetical protein CK203_013139 [Vitis vinifera]